MTLETSQQQRLRAWIFCSIVSVKVMPSSPFGLFGVESDEETATELYENASNSSESPRYRPLHSSPNSTFSERLKIARKLIPSYPGRAKLVKSNHEMTGLKRKTDEENISGGLETSNCPMVREFQSFLREHAIIMEFKYLSQNPLSGVYAVPSLNTLQVWHGIIFIRAGPYRNGIFRFIVILQDDFPDSRPLLKFTTPVFHPQVHPVNWVLNLDVSFPQWEKGKNNIWQVLKFLKSCFYNVDTWGGTNEAAINTIHSDIEKFKDEAELCAADSVRSFDDELSPGRSSDDDGNVLSQKNLSDVAFREGKRMMLTGELPSWMP